jgi:hypothetical protein
LPNRCGLQEQDESHLNLALNQKQTGINLTSKALLLIHASGKLYDAALIQNGLCNSISRCDTNVDKKVETL